MLVDYEFAEMVKTPGRIAVLGFRPQSEVLSNHLLPYARELDGESTKFLEQVKTNLAKSVMLREMKPGCGVWSSRLMRYIKVYGLKFSKEDHIAFIKLAYELVLIPDLEPSNITKFSTMFVMLSKKRYLIPPEELTLPWRPLYEMGRKLFHKNDTNIGMYHYLRRKQPPKEGGDMLSMIRKFLSGTGLDDALNMFGFAVQDDNELVLEGTFLSMVKCARPYFPLSATKEILEELLPQVNPWTNEGYVMGQIAMFLPVALAPQHADFGHKLWLDELLTLFDTCYNSQAGVTDLVMLFAGLAKRNPGAVDWSPLMPKIFSRIIHSLHFPVGYKEMQIFKGNTLDTKHLASWVIWSINPDGVVLKHLRGFLAAVESYLQTANSGRWSFRLRDFLRKLAREFLNRVRRECKKEFKDTWENTTPDNYKLTQEDITEFITIVLGPTLQAVYNRSGSLDISLALQNLATLRPAMVIPPLLEKLQDSLTSLTEPHRVTASMAAVASIARALLRGPTAGYPEGPTHVVPLLMAVLPGLDPNDIKKTLVSLHFILIFAWMVPIIDCSSAQEYYSDLTEEELLTCESTAQLEDFVLMFLDRLFVLIESSVLENVRLDTKDTDCTRSKNDTIVETAISSASYAVLVQCSPKIFNEALRKFKAFATESTFETNVSGSMVGVMLRVFNRTNSAATAAAFLPKLCEELDHLITEETLLDENPSRDILYRLVLLKGAVECDGIVLLKYMPMIIPILDKILRFNDKRALERSCGVLSHIVQYFSFVEVRDCRSSSKDYSAAPEKWLPVREWGHGCDLKDVKLRWHVPSKNEAKCAQMLINRYLKPAIETLRKWANSEVTLTREQMYRTLSVVNALMSCGAFFPQPNEEFIPLIESQVPATTLPFTTGVKYTVTVDGQNVRVVLTNLMMNVQARMLADKSDDTKSFEMLIKIWERILLVKCGRGTSTMETRLRAFNALERAMEGRGSEAAGGGAMRMIIAEAARIQDDSRADFMCEAGITPSALNALDALFQLSINTYSVVRQQAQNRLFWMLSHYPYAYRVLVPKLSTLLLSVREGDEWHERHKGALYILHGPRTAPLIARRDWEAARRLWPDVLRSPLSEKQSIHKLEQVLNDTIHRNFPTVNTRLVIPESAVEAARYFLTEEQFNEPTFAAFYKNAVEKEKLNSDREEQNYTALVNELAEIAETPNIQWRRLEHAMQMLTFCPSLQTNYPPRVVKLALQSLLHDNITVRRTALRLTHFALRQCKRELKTLEIDPYEFAGMERPEKHVPGYRKDLEWALWSKDKVPLTDEDWEKPVLRNSNYGYYIWPKKLMVAAPPGEQKMALTLSPEDMTVPERYIYEFFTNDSNVEKLIAFFTVEDKKGKDKFSALRFCVFKLLFSNFGPAVSSKFIPAALRCAADTQEAPQRFAAEVTSAAVRAPRYWTKEHALKMYSDTADIICAGLTSVTPETMEDWGTALATGIEKLDPIRGSFLVERLVEFCVPPPTEEEVDLDNNSSFVMCARLYSLQGVIGALKWRSGRVAKLVLDRLEAANFVHHPYQIVRDAVGSLLMTIFDNELVFPGGACGDVPSLADFLGTVTPRLSALYDENGDIVLKPAVSMSLVERAGREGAAPPCGELAPPPAGRAGLVGHVARMVHAHASVDDTTQVAEGVPPIPSSASEDNLAVREMATRLHEALRLSGDAVVGPKDHARATNLLTTVLRTCMGVTVRSAGGSVRAQYLMVPCAFAVAGRGAAGAEELPRAAGVLLAALANVHHSPDTFDHALHVLQQCATDRSWWARLACLDFAQPLLFYGLPYLCADPTRAVKAEKLALDLMRDPRLEVRQSASKLLTGLMHCHALPDENKTLSMLTQACSSEELVERHHGVLGLCSYLLSRPYSLGPKLGDVLAELAKHTNAPDPIPASIRTVLADFRRTHQDDWAKHRAQLTEDELDLLADLTSPPSYCA